MRKQKPLGVNALAEEVEAIDKRREELGMSRAKYLTTLAKMDIEYELLVAEKAGDGRPVINLLQQKKPVVRIEKSEMEAWARKTAILTAKLCLESAGIKISEKELQWNSQNV